MGAMSPPSRDALDPIRLCSLPFQPHGGPGSSIGGDGGGGEPLHCLHSQTGLMGQVCCLEEDTAHPWRSSHSDARGKRAVTYPEHLLSAWPHVRPPETTTSDVFLVGEGGRRVLHSPVCSASSSPRWADLNPGPQAGNTSQGGGLHPLCTNSVQLDLSQPI